MEMPPVFHLNENTVGLHWNLISYKEMQAKKKKEKYTRYPRVQYIKLHCFPLLEVSDERQDQQM